MTLNRINWVSVGVVLTLFLLF
ncbi:hypothetical protein EK599_01860 [Vibrio sp. T187]|nr:hypothetical protein [Vibrio sp. T187]